MAPSINGTRLTHVNADSTSQTKHTKKGTISRKLGTLVSKLHLHKSKGVVAETEDTLSTLIEKFDRFKERHGDLFTFSAQNRAHEEMLEHGHVTIQKQPASKQAVFDACATAKNTEREALVNDILSSSCQEMFMATPCKAALVGKDFFGKLKLQSHIPPKAEDATINTCLDCAKFLQDKANQAAVQYKLGEQAIDMLEKIIQEKDPLEAMPEKRMLVRPSADQSMRKDQMTQADTKFTDFCNKVANSFKERLLQSDAQVDSAVILNDLAENELIPTLSWEEEMEMLRQAPQPSVRLSAAEKKEKEKAQLFNQMLFLTHNVEDYEIQDWDNLINKFAELDSFKLTDDDLNILKTVQDSPVMKAIAKNLDTAKEQATDLKNSLSQNYPGIFEIVAEIKAHNDDVLAKQYATEFKSFLTEELQQKYPDLFERDAWGDGQMAADELLLTDQDVARIGLDTFLSKHQSLENPASHKQVTLGEAEYTVVSVNLKALNDAVSQRLEQISAMRESTRKSGITETFGAQASNDFSRYEEAQVHLNRIEQVNTLKTMLDDAIVISESLNTADRVTPANKV